MMPDKNNMQRLRLLALLMLAALVIAMTHTGAADAAGAREELGVCYGRVLSADTVSKIVLSGSAQKDSPYVTDITIEIYEGKEGAPAVQIRPPVDSGYNPRLMAESFTGNGLDQIFLGIESGGSGGYGYFYVFSAQGGSSSVLFDYSKFSEENRYRAHFADCYKLKVFSKRTKQAFCLDISGRPKEYLGEIYNADGTLKAKRTANVSTVNTVFPYFNSAMGRFELSIYQRITGLYNADLLGYINTRQGFSDGVFLTLQTTLNSLPLPCKGTCKTAQ